MLPDVLRNDSGTRARWTPRTRRRPRGPAPTFSHPTRGLRGARGHRRSSPASVCIGSHGRETAWVVCPVVRCSSAASAARAGGWSSEERGAGACVAGPFDDRAEAAWVAACRPGTPAGARPVYGVRRPSGVLERGPSAEDWAWLGHVGEQLERLPEGWDAELPGDEEPLTTLLVELAAALVEAGLPLHDAAGPGRDAGGSACDHCRSCAASSSPGASTTG